MCQKKRFSLKSNAFGEQLNEPCSWYFTKHRRNLCLVFKSYNEVLLLCFVRLLASHLKKVFCNLKAGIKKKLPCDFVYQASPR